MYGMFLMLFGGKDFFKILDSKCSKFFFIGPINVATI